MARATELTELGISRSFSPWWYEIASKGHGIAVVVEDPNEPEGSGKTVSKTLDPAAIHASFAALKDSYLCCGEVMEDEGYGCGCAQDADLILQHATFGEIVYG